MKMKAVRIAALGAALLMGGATIASAQAGAAQQQGERRGGRNMQMNGIELTDAQKVQYEAIQKKYQPEMTSIRNDMMNGGDRAELMKKGMTLRENSAKEIRAILTPEQQVVFDKNMAEQKARMEERQKQGPPSR
jgi:Spy/CpxP family protein refolding chaperone